MGPWAEAVLKAVGGAPSELAVEDFRGEAGLVTAQVDGRTVTLAAPTIRPRLWAAFVGNARGPLERAVRGEVQSEQLLQLMSHDWEEPLVPRGIVRVCSCDGGDCEHSAALGAALAAAVDEDPAVLLRWRGCLDGRRADDDEPWRGGTLPSLPTPARRPPQSAPQRFGASGVRIGDEDLVETLVRAYTDLG